MASGPPERGDLLSELRGTLARIELALSLVADAIAWTDESGRIQWCNASFDALVEASHISVLGERLIKLVPLWIRGQSLPPERHPATLVLGSQAHVAGHYEFKKTDRMVILEISARRAATGRDAPIAVFVIRDVTERKRAEEEIKKLNEDLKRRAVELEALNKEMETFSYSVSHDLRAPLRSIDGFSQALLEEYRDKLDPDGQDYLRRVRDACQYMSQLIDDMLNLSVVARAELRRQTVNLTAVARTIAAELQRTEPKRQVEFVIAAGLIVSGDERLLRVVLENLLGNAWKFTSKKPRASIELGVAENEGRPVYYVRDDGVGFDMAYAKKLFGVFQRLHARTEFPGTGVGLATVQRIISKHGGRVWAEGSLDKGATFYFTLSA